MEEIK
jgi:hypothetical protein